MWCLLYESYLHVHKNYNKKIETKLKKKKHKIYFQDKDKLTKSTFSSDF